MVMIGKGQVRGSDGQGMQAQAGFIVELFLVAA